MTLEFRSTSRMISSFSEAEKQSRLVLPIRRHAFFEQTVFQGQIGDNLLERGRLTPQILDLVRSCGTSRVTGQALLASLQELIERRSRDPDLP